MAIPNSPFSFETLGAEVDRFLSGLSSYANEYLSAANASAGEVKTTLKNIVPRLTGDFMVNLTENETSFILTCELPGVEKEDISIKLLNPTTVLIKTADEEKSGVVTKTIEESDAVTETTEESGAVTETTEGTTFTPAEENTYHLHEIKKQPRQRTIDLPSEVAKEGGKATFKNGILELILPKACPTAEIGIEIE